MPTPFETYFSKVQADQRGGKATEHTYRSTLESYMEALERGVNASNDPKHIACGAPDFIVEKGKVPLGYVETKDVGADLDSVEKSEQMQRYRKALSNLILTDYLEFRWYVNGEHRHIVRAIGLTADNKLTRASHSEEELGNLFRDFFATEAPTVTTPKELAERLASVTHFIRDQIVAAFSASDASVRASLEARYKAFQTLLLPALKPEEFADLYAQAMTYGLFAAKLSAPEGEKFTLTGAYQFLFGSRFLRRLFSDVSEELDEIEIIRPYLQDIVSLLNRADFASILADFGRRTQSEDPVVHFYETFLAEYNPKLRKSRGVYYTPEPVVQFMVRAVHDLLKTRFNKPWGLADESVKVLDPAAGTGTFLYYIIRQIHEEVVEKRGQAGQWAEKSRELLGRLFGFELLIAPYVVSHLKLGLLLKDLGAPLDPRGERLQVYLTNTLEEGTTRAEQLAGLGSYIAEEASDAAHVKKQSDIMVVIGNPPYSGHSANASVDRDGKPNFIGKLLREYYFVDGAPLGERNPKWLQDDYVKFIRFGEWRIQKSGHGILAFITNHGYLDNPTFRGMRQHLMQTFDEIYVLDLHGNSKKKEKAPDGGKDENVFDIQQGVSILVAIKHPLGKRATTCKVKHSNIWGNRIYKYKTLGTSDLEKILWEEITPEKPFHLFIPQNKGLQQEYQKYWKLNEIMPVNSAGIVTARDSLTIHLSENELLTTIQDFANLPVEEARSKYMLGEDTRDWKIHLAQSDLLDSHQDKNRVQNILYRPFDKRFTYYTGKTRGFLCMPRYEVSRHMVKSDNLALLTARNNKSTEMNHFLISDSISETKCAESTIQSYIFPLFINTFAIENTTSPFSENSAGWEPNFSPEFLKEINKKLDITFQKEQKNFSSIFDKKINNTPYEYYAWDIVFYIYAVFYCPAYRSRYADFLKADFPRLPLTSNKKQFFALAAKGSQLVALHLLKSPKVNEFITTYPEAGGNCVEKVVFTPEARGRGRVWINAKQYFGGVPEAVWNFHIGGYQVCEKWLKDRKGRTLSGEDISHYQRVVVALNETIRLMSEIDELIPKWPME